MRVPPLWHLEALWNRLSYYPSLVSFSLHLLGPSFVGLLARHAKRFKL